jgi:hypothetical protein
MTLGNMRQHGIHLLAVFSGALAAIIKECWTSVSLMMMYPREPSARAWCAPFAVLLVQMQGRIGMSRFYSDP